MLKIIAFIPIILLVPLATTPVMG